jgi:glycosyltransferase involved in cell wall biosynthesis
MIYPVRDLFRSPTRLKRWQSRTAMADAVYLNASHNQLETPQRLAWANRSNMRSVFFIHDTIPIDYPEFVAPVNCGRHEQRMMTTSSMAALVIVNSTATKHRIESFLSGAGLRVPDITIVPLGVADAFLRVGAEMRGRPIQGPPAHPYFVTLSTIEPRKNLLFLFTVWRRLIERLGPRTPRLVVAGARGWENENIADVLERSRELGPYLVEVSDLCDDALARLLSGATALVQPSSIEGFGLPLIEGLTLGLPVVASDIAAHREVAAGYADFVDPIDGLRWLDTIEALANAANGLAERKRNANAAYVPTTWRSHVDTAMTAISELR